MSEHEVQDKRVVGRPFPKGASPNPGGIKKAIKHAQEKFVAAADSSADRMIAWSEGKGLGEDPETQKWATAQVLDRGLGKAVARQNVAVRREEFVALMPAPMPPDEWVRTFSPQGNAYWSDGKLIEAQVQEHDPAEVQPDVPSGADRADPVLTQPQRLKLID